MKKIFPAAVAVLLAAMLLLTACGGPVQAPPPEKSVERSNDLSVYRVQAAAKAETRPLPPDPGLKYVDTLFMQELLASRPVTSNKRTRYDEPPPEWNFVVVDSRPPAKYQEGHINGAINIPDAEFEKFSSRLPADKNTPLYFYCGGLECKLSPSSAHKAMKLGYTQVYVYQEGDPFWKAAGNYLVATPEYVASLLLEENMMSPRSKPFLLIDTRPYSTYFAGHLPGAMQADDGVFAQKFLPLMPRDKDTEIITYCGGFNCAKSHTVARLLRAEGYRNVLVFAGGLPAWEAAGLPVIGADGVRGKLDITGGKPSRKLTPTDFRAKIAAGALVLDVRTAEERAPGAVKGSLHIPDTEFKANPQSAIAKLPTDKAAQIVIHCAAGGRASQVADILAAQGYVNAFWLNSRIAIAADGSFSFE